MQKRQEQNKQDEIQLAELLSINNVRLFKIQNTQQQQVDFGTLKIYEIPEYKTYLFKLNQFNYIITKQIPILTSVDETQPLKRAYIFPSTQGCYNGILIDNVAELQILECLDAILQEFSNLIVKNKNQNKQQAQQQFSYQQQNQQQLQLKSEKNLKSQNYQQNSSQQNQQEQTIVQEEQKTQKLSQKVGNVLSLLGNKAKNGLILAAEKAQPYIQQGGEYLKKKIQKNPQETTVSQGTKTKMKIASTASNAMLVYTKAQVEALVQVSKMIGKEIGDQFEQSEQGQKIQQHKNYSDVKAIGKGAVHLAAGIYEGLYEALTILGRNIGEQGCNIIEHKYGQDVGQVAKDGTETIGNVANIGRVYKNTVVKEIFNETNNNNNNNNNIQKNNNLNFQQQNFNNKK